MSIIKVNSIKNTSTNDGGIAIDNSGHVQVDGVQLPTAGALSNRNLIINGAMQVAQRGTSTTGVGTAVAYNTVDRWRFADASDPTARFTETQSTDAPDGFSNSRKFEVTTADSAVEADEQQYTDHFIEGQNLQHLGYGTSSAKQLTLSFYVKASVAQTYGLNIQMHDGGGSYYGVSYAVNAADTWERKTITINGNTSLSIDNDNGRGLRVKFGLNVGSNYISGTDATSWSASGNEYGQHSNTWVGTVGNTWQITGVQLEVGEKATPFEHRSYGDELARCQRYFQLLQHSSGVGLGTTVLARCTWPLKVTMRANMTIAAVGTPSWFHGTGGATFSALGTNYSIPEMAQMDVTVTGGGGSSVPHFSDSGGTSYFTASAEL